MVNEPQPPPAGAPATPPLHAPAPRAQVMLAVGAAGLAAAGGAGWATTLEVGGWWVVWRRVALDLRALLPLGAVRIDAPSATALLHPHLLTAGLAYRWMSGGGRAAVLLGAGDATLWLGSDGMARDRFHAGVGDDFFSTGPYARAGGCVALLPRLWACAGALAGMLAKRSVISAAGEPISAWGRGFAAAGLDIALGVP
jgi:hypothetical protein